MNGKDIELNEDQIKAREYILENLKSGSKLITLGGYAGTGKTLLVSRLAADFAKHSIAFCAFTGKAASVVRGKLTAVDAMREGTDYCGTIHGLIYEPIFGRGEQIVGFKKVDSIEYDLIIVDEASMLNKEIFDDLVSFGIPIIAVGDHGQLPPVMGTFNLMQDPQVKLTRIHRQEAGDPIIEVSILARETGAIPTKEFSPLVQRVRRQGTAWKESLDKIDWLEDALILCARNSTRASANAYMRKRMGFGAPEPMVGEVVICLKNNRRVGIYNGMCGELVKIERSGKNFYTAEIDMDSAGSYGGRIFSHQFGAEYTIREWKGILPKDMGDLFDWGYCLTVHKAQGSEADSVVVLEERIARTDDEWRRWLYTAVTRSRKRLLIIGD